MKIETKLKEHSENIKEASVIFTDVHMTHFDMIVTIESILKAFYYKHCTETLLALNEFMDYLADELGTDDDE